MFEDFVDGEADATDLILEWQLPRISFSTSFTQLEMEEPSSSEESLTTSNSDFEFNTSMSASISDDSQRELFLHSTADELFYDGKVLPRPIASQIGDEEASGFTKAFNLDYIQVLDQASDQHLNSHHSTSLDPYPSLSRVVPRTPKRSLSWSILLRNFFTSKKDESKQTKESFNNIFAGFFKPWKLFGRGARTKLVKTKSSRAGVALLQFMSIPCSFSKDNENEIATEHHEQHQDDAVEGFRSCGESIDGQKNIAKRIPDSMNLSAMYSSGLMVPCPMISNRRSRGYAKGDMPERSLHISKYKNLSSSNTKLHIADIQAERPQNKPKFSKKMQNQGKAFKQRDHPKVLYQKNKRYYDMKSSSVKPTSTPILHVAECLRCPASSSTRANRKGMPIHKKSAFKVPLA